MLTAQEIMEALAPYRLEAVAADTGLAFNTVRRYASGRVVDPPQSTLSKLTAWIQAEENSSARAKALR